MKKNVSGQSITAQLTSRTDGSPVTTGTTTVYVTVDAGTQTLGTGTVTHEGLGTWSYVPTQAETNANQITFTFLNSAAVTASIQLFTEGLYQVSGVELITVGTSVPRTKRFIVAITETGDTLYGIIRRESDGYLLNDATDDFASAPADPYNAFTEDATILGRYAFDSATATWTDGWYTCVIYKQAGGSPAPVSDTVVGSGTVLLQADQATDSTGTSETIHAYALCTLAQMHTELNIPTATTADDDRLIRAINAATDAIESHTNRKLKQRVSASTEYYDGTGGNIMDGGRQLWPDEWPLESGCITSLHDDSARAFGSDKLINSAHYVIRYQRYIELSDIVGPRVFVEAWQNLKLIYAPGYSTVPSDLQKACIIVATDFYLLEKTQKANVSSRSDAAGSHSFKDYALNPTAVLILKPYVRGWQMIPERGAWVR